MAFLVSDAQTERHARIRGFLSQGEPAIAVLLAAADFEWTVRRAIIALGKSSNVEIREGVLKNCHGLNAYKEAWEKEAMKTAEKSLPQIIGSWNDFVNAFNLRHKLIHGITSVTADYATTRVETILLATTNVYIFCDSQCGIDLFSRLPIKTKKKH